MTRIIEFLIALGIVLGLFVLVALVLPSHRHLSESVETNRKMTIVYDTLNSMQRFKDWNPVMARDPATKLELSGPAAGVGARVDYDSATQSYVGKGSWTVIESVPGEKVVIAVDSPSLGHDKKATFTLEPTGKNGRNIKVTETYDIDYGWNLFGRIAGLYASRTIGDDLKLGLGRLTTMLASVPNFDYRAEGSTLTGLSVVDVPEENLLVVSAGNIDRSNDAIRKSIQDNLEWINRTIAANGLESAGPFRIITTDFGAEKYAFDVAMPVKKVGATGALKLNIPGGSPVSLVHVDAHRAAHATYTGYMAELDAARNSLRAWAVTQGNEVVDRPYESWKGGLDKAFTADGSFDIYWAIK